jgi:hypothetical protein
VTPRRATDVGVAGAWWGRWGRDLITFAAVGLSAWAFFKGETERRERTDQACTIFERKHKQDVDALISTYRYLGTLSGKELAEPLNRAVLAGLPRTIREANLDDAPPYCDKPGVGEPEPDPKLPPRPGNLPAA